MIDPPEGFTGADYCKTVRLGTEGARRLESRAAIFHDLSFVLNACELLIAHLKEQSAVGPPVESTLADALWTSILIAYERCFSSGKRISLSFSDLDSIDPSGGALALHKHYEKMRDKHLAHSINPFATTLVGAVLSSESSGVRQVDGIATLYARHSAPLEEEVFQLGGLVSKLRERVGKECERLSGEIVLDEARALDVELLYAADDMRFVAPGPDDAARPRT